MNHLFINKNNELGFSIAKLLIKSLGIFIFLLAASCASRVKPAPITNVTVAEQPVTNMQPSQKPAANIPKPEDKPEVTAIEENKDDVSETNTKPKQSEMTSENGTDNANSNSEKWGWPTKGKITQTFKQNGKGINIGGTEGQAINAISGGKVLYSGNGLKGYGNLIIIKHDSTYLSAYAHNKTNLVKQGATVKAGQKIATMGKSGAGAVLHFEIRKNGKPIDPTTMLNNQ